MLCVSELKPLDETHIYAEEGGVYIRRSGAMSEKGIDPHDFEIQTIPQSFLEDVEPTLRFID